MTQSFPYHGDDFCLEHGRDHMRSTMGNPIPWCQACEEEREALIACPPPRIASDGDVKSPAPWPGPTPEMLNNDPLFEAIWSAIRSWDINVPSVYGGYCGATGNHARAIYDAIRSLSPEASTLPNGDPDRG